MFCVTCSFVDGNEPEDLVDRFHRNVDFHDRESLKYCEVVYPLFWEIVKCFIAND